MNDSFELAVSVSIRSQGGHGTLNVFETQPIKGETFRDVAEILARFHRLGEIIRGELAEQEDQADEEDQDAPPCTCDYSPPHAVNCKYRYWKALREDQAATAGQAHVCLQAPEHLGRIAHDAYADAVEPRQSTSFGRLTQHQRDAWSRAGAAVVQHIVHVHGTP